MTDYQEAAREALRESEGAVKYPDRADLIAKGQVLALLDIADAIRSLDIWEDPDGGEEVDDDYRGPKPDFTLIQNLPRAAGDPAAPVRYHGGGSR